MPQKSPIEWTDYTSNPIRATNRSGVHGWHCERISEGCRNCYAERINRRLGTHLDFARQSRSKVDAWLSGEEMRKLATSKALAGKRVFLGDMTDIFGEWVSDAWLDTIFATIAARPDVTFQVLTKRPERAADYLGDGLLRCKRPLPNLWLGTSVEDQGSANYRVRILLDCPAAVRFVSYEPAIGPLDLATVERPEKFHRQARGWSAWLPEFLHWVIVGGESGPKARPCDRRWILSIVKQCRAFGIAPFVKQLGAFPVSEYGGQSFTPHGARSAHAILDPKGGDPAEWPVDLRVREWPNSEVTTC